MLSPAPLGLPDDLPATWQTPDYYAFFRAKDGALLRYGVWRTQDRARGTILLLGGRGEFVEKYGMELAKDLLARRLDVISIDWRGQGLSARQLTDRQKGHIDSFDTYLHDFSEFLTKVVLPQEPRPPIALAHSMGAHLVLRHLAESGSALPLAGAFLCAPLTGLRHQSAIEAVLKILPQYHAIDERFLINGSGRFRPICREFIGNRVTHDERRFGFGEMWLRADPRLALGGPTVGWVRQCLHSILSIKAAGYLERIAAPVAILSAGQDQLVDSTSHTGVTARIAGASLTVYADARHEIMMETDSIRDRFLAEFDRFTDRLTVGS